MMEEPQPPFRALRAVQSEPNPKKSFQTNSASAAHTVPVESHPAELPEPSALVTDVSEPAPKSAAKRKSSTAKRKSQTTSSKQKSVATFRQVWETNQQLAMEELQRLEQQAERINQLLAQRTKRKPPASQVKPLTELGRALPPIVALPQLPTESDDTEALKAQAERINQLLSDLQAVLTETPEDGSTNFKQTHALSVPDSQAAQEAAETAEALRYLIHQECTAPATAQPIKSPVRSEPTLPPELPRRKRRSLQTSRRSRSKWFQLSKQVFQLPEKLSSRVGDALLWIVLAAALRVGCRSILALFPWLTPVAILLMLAPAALAVYLALFARDAGFTPVYRLFLLMLGLLIGGRL